MLQRFRTLFNLPSAIRGNIRKGEYDLAVREYQKAKSIVLPSHVRQLLNLFYLICYSTGVTGYSIVWKLSVNGRNLSYLSRYLNCWWFTIGLSGLFSLVCRTGACIKKSLPYSPMVSCQQLLWIIKVFAMCVLDSFLFGLYADCVGWWSMHGQSYSVMLFFRLVADKLFLDHPAHSL